MDRNARIKDGQGVIQGIGDIHFFSIGGHGDTHWSIFHGHITHDGGRERPGIEYGDCIILSVDHIRTVAIWTKGNGYRALARLDPGFLVRRRVKQGDKLAA